MSIPQHCVDDTAAVMRRIEGCLDEAVVLTGQLFSELVKAQTEGNLHPMFMHSEIFARLPALTQSLFSTRGDAVEVHKGMNRIARQLGLQASALFGPPEGKEWPWPIAAVGGAPAEAAAQIRGPTLTALPCDS